MLWYLECLDIRHPFSIFVLVLHWDRDLPSSVGGSGLAPLESDKTQRCGISVWIAEGRMGRHDTPDHHTQTLRSSTNHYSTPIGVVAHAWQSIGELVRGRWLGVNRLLVRFREPRLIRSRVVLIHEEARHEGLCQTLVTEGNKERDILVESSYWSQMKDIIRRML